MPPELGSRIEPDGRFVLDELRLRATRIVRERWRDGDEPALSVETFAVATKPCAAGTTVMADVDCMRSPATLTIKSWSPRRS